MYRFPGRRHIKQLSQQIKQTLFYTEVLENISVDIKTGAGCLVGGNHTRFCVKTDGVDKGVINFCVILRGIEFRHHHIRYRAIQLDMNLLLSVRT